MQKTSPVITFSRLLFMVVALIALVYGVVMNVTKQISTTPYLITVVTAIVGFAITYVPSLMYQTRIATLPIKLQEFIAIFTIMAMFFGEILSFYDRFIWWDTMLHFSSGIMLSLIGLSLFKSLNQIGGNYSQGNPVVAVVFAVLFAIACGALWEIVEFAGDSLLGMNMQRWQTISSDVQRASNLSNPGLVNTMKDIICDVVGSLCSMALMVPFKRKSIFNSITAQLLN